jgi:uncharacterized membrane protein
MSSNDWKLEKDSNGITAFTRAKKGSSFREYQVETRIKTTLEALLALQRDYKNHPKWIDSVASTTLLNEGDDFYEIHTIANAPWPVKNRDSAIRNDIIIGDDSVTIEFNTDNKLAPVAKGCERVGSVNGFWQFNKEEDGEISILYSAHIEPGGLIPAFVANMFATDVPFNTIKSMIKQVKKYE